MTAKILKHPARAAECVCHDDQLDVWAHELFVDLAFGADAIKDDLDYDGQLIAEKVIRDKIRSIVKAAFTHPEAR